MITEAEKSTIRYYDAHAEEYGRQTLTIPMSALYEPFLSRLEDRARILDAGCGIGRDTKAFKQRGYDVVAFDASKKLVHLSESLTKVPTYWLRFQDVEWTSAFDGIWASASLLHIPRNEIDEVLDRLSRSLRPNGVLYASFKIGAGERWAGDRFFNDYNVSDFEKLISSHPFSLEWISERREGQRDSVSWLNAIARKTY